MVICACVPPRVGGAALTWIPAVRTVRHVCGDNAPCSCLYRAFKRIHGVHCWLLFFFFLSFFRPSGKLGGAVLASTLLHVSFYFSPAAEHENMASHSSREGESPLFPTAEQTTGGGVRPSAFHLAAAHVCALRAFYVVFYSTVCTRLSSLRDGDSQTGRCSTKMSSLGEKSGETELQFGSWQ